MAEQPVNLLTAIYLGVFSRAEQRVLQAIFKAIAEGGGRCVATLAMLARNAITRAVEIGLLEKMERRSSCAVSLPNILTYGKQSLESPRHSRNPNLAAINSAVEMARKRAFELHRTELGFDLGGA
jgi:hypothetical protein